MSDDAYQKKLEEAARLVNEVAGARAASVGAGAGGRGGEPVGEASRSTSRAQQPTSTYEILGLSTLTGAKVGGAIGVFFVAIALLFLLRFASGRGWLTPTVLVLLATLAGVACVIAGMHLKKREHRHANTVLGTGVGVLVVAHVAVLFGLLWIFSVASDGQAKATSAWGAYGIVLLLASYVLEQRGVQVAGLGTLLLAAVKLLIFDWFAPISAMWRISMFLGFGLGFIALSYSVFRRQEDP